MKKGKNAFSGLSLQVLGCGYPLVQGGRSRERAVEKEKSLERSWDGVRPFVTENKRKRVKTCTTDTEGTGSNKTFCMFREKVAGTRVQGKGRQKE